MSDSPELEKRRRIKKEASKLNRLFKKIDAEKKKAVDSLIKNAAFMTITLEDLQEEINENGVTEEYQNGANQFGKKKSSAVEVYNTMIKNHSAIIRQLTDLLPKEDPVPVDDGFDSFVSERDD